MTDTLLEALSRIDPLPAAAEPPPAADFLAALDPTIRALREPMRRSRRRGYPTRPRMAVAAAVLTGATLATALALSGLGGGHLNVAAAAYRATAGGSGVLHMTVLTERVVGSSTSTTSEQIWTAQDPRRMRTVQTDSGETREGALTTTPMRSLVWTSAQPSVIKESTPANIPLTESGPTQTIHKLLGEGRATVVGKVSFEGREAWQLEIHPQTAPAPFNGTAVPEPVLIVAAGTYVPLELVEHFAINENGKSELAEQRERYTTYEELPANPHSETLLELAPHAGATVRGEG